MKLFLSMLLVSVTSVLHADSFPFTVTVHGTCSSPGYNGSVEICELGVPGIGYICQQGIYSLASQGPGFHLNAGSMSDTIYGGTLAYYELDNGSLQNGDANWKPTGLNLDYYCNGYTNRLLSLTNLTGVPMNFTFHDPNDPYSHDVDVTLQPGESASVPFTTGKNSDGSPDTVIANGTPVIAAEGVSNSIPVNMSASYGSNVNFTANPSNTYQDGQQNSGAVFGTNGLVLYSANAFTNTSEMIAESANAQIQKLAEQVALNQSLDSNLSNLLAFSKSANQNSDTIWSNLIAAVHSNTPTASGSNFISVSNVATVASNVWVMNWPSNAATESTLEAVTNLLGFAWTNSNSPYDTNFLTGLTGGVDSVYVFGGVTNWSDAVAASAGPLDAVESWFNTAASSFVIPEVAEGGSPSPMILTFPGTGYQIDFNPLDNADIANLFYYAKMLIQWLLCIYYANRCLADSRWAISVCNQTHGSMNPAGVKQNTTGS